MRARRWWARCLTVLLVTAAGVSGASTATAAGCVVTVTGTLTDAITGAPVSRGHAWIVNADGSGYFGPGPEFASAEADASGRYSVTLPCRPGDAVVAAAGGYEKAGYYSTHYGRNATDIAHAQLFSLRTSRTIEGQDVLLTPPGWFVPKTPTRVVDTRRDASGPLGPASSRSFPLPGLPADTTAVVLNVTATRGTARTSFVSVVDEGSRTVPTQSALNTVAGRDVANQVTARVVPPRISGRTEPRVTLYNNAGSTHLVADLVGYYATSAGAGLVTVDPRRALDTRSTTPLRAGETRTLPLAPPPGAVAAAVTVTSTRATAPTSYVSVFPAGDPGGPSTSTLNAYRGDDVSNLAVVPLGDDGAIALRNDQGTTHLVVDVVGWFVEGEGAAYYPINPKRADQPMGVGPARFVITNPDVEISKFPAALLLNLTSSRTTLPTYVAAWDDTYPRPATSVANARPGADVGTAVLLRSSSATNATVTVGRGYSLVMIDVTGYFAVPGGEPS
ncbi:MULTISPECIES: hypothetical protein [Cellulomonas]|uniref:Carboxypeptidase regulatory-like domain-containing protein n=1 Tax=Cellulomonas iranensis TaxID=76862 RepID=A0ABU0GK92_9CELL|nr:MULTISPECIES: hypothetical protein [Cellulomonas]MDQ0424972.1 hypothetical protein [Cellulomonas iranensis]